MKDHLVTQGASSRQSACYQKVLIAGNRQEISRRPSLVHATLRNHVYENVVIEQVPNRHNRRDVLQCVAVCCSVLQCVAVCCRVLQCVAVCCSVLQCVAGDDVGSGSSTETCNVLQSTSRRVVRCSVLQCLATCCSVLQCAAVCCSALQTVAQPYRGMAEENKSALDKLYAAINQ